MLLENAFDPNRGIFILTSDGFCYPNPNVKLLMEDFEAHYFFMGRILAKAIQSKMLSQLKFAGFFLQKILSKNADPRLDIDYLVSLDPQIYKNLLYLKDYKSNVEDLELNFALTVEEFDQTRTIELKPGGKDILVTNDNKIEYIHLLSDFKLNKQINEQVIAFRNGISNIINLDIVRLFNFNELQTLVSGCEDTIDVNDWKQFTVYSGSYTYDHPVIENFWQVVESLSEDHKRKLLKFSTSRSRPPLFGFKNLIPNFAILNSSSTDRLPTASTCLNLLKLPPIDDFNIMREKIVCAIESDSGFDLS
jgi:ubiquitin-protein ligase E3 C